MVWITRLAVPVISLLAGAGLEVSGFEDIRVALALWSFAGLWALGALMVPVLTRWQPPTWFVIPLLRDRVHWARYAPVITPMSEDIGVTFELAADGQSVYQARTYTSYQIRNRSPFGRAVVSFVDCCMEVKPHTGRVRNWHTLPLGPAHQNIEVTIPVGEVRNQALEFVSRWEGEDIARNSRLDFDFDWKLTGITGRLIEGNLAGKGPTFHGRHLGRVDR
jgi:hypothetical protein